MDLIGLRDWLGHSDIKVTAQRYIHLMNGHVYRGVEILDLYDDDAALPQDEGNDDDNGTNITMTDSTSCGHERDTLVTMGSC